MNEYELRIQSVKSQIKKLKPPLKASKAEERDYKAAKEKLQKELALIENYAALYSAAQVGSYVLARNKTGVIVDKFVNSGGIPQLWICWGMCDIPYPEYPSTGGEWHFQKVAACDLSEAPHIQEKEAA